MTTFFFKEALTLVHTCFYVKNSHLILTPFWQFCQVYLTESRKPEKNLKTKFYSAPKPEEVVHTEESVQV